jgi:Ser/Thr protein kinase RdoA (MazF antagonist)
MTSGALTTATVGAALAGEWGMTADSLTLNQGGMNSQTWLLRTEGRRYVAKAVPSERAASFEAGLAIAEIVDAAGIPAGAAVATRNGHRSVRANGSVLALLRFVDGAELTGESVEERRLIGSTLGGAHQALAGREVAEAGRFHWIEPRAAHLGVRPWIRPAVEAAVAAYDAIPPESLTWGLLHTDPAPEAFRLDPTTGTCGLIDWDLGVVGPLLYDLASAEMYVGGPQRSSPLLDAYLATGALRAEEVDRALRPMGRMRWAVQADYFAMRIATDDLTGIDEQGENEKGLEDARRALID